MAESSGSEVSVVLDLVHSEYGPGHVFKQKMGWVENGIKRINSDLNKGVGTVPFGNDMENLASQSFHHDINHNVEFNLPDLKKQLGWDSYSLTSKSWLGHIIGIEDNTVRAKMFDLDGDNHLYEISEFGVDEFDSDEDRRALRIGSMFYFSIGTKVHRGTKEGVYIFRLRRIPPWTTADIDSASDRANKLRNVFGE